MLNLNSLLIGSQDSKALIEFYKKVLDRDADWEEGDWGGFEVGNGYMTIGPHSEVKGKSKEPERILINFETDDVKGEFARIKGLGVTVVKAPYQPEQASDMWIATFADPDGNYFQLMSPMSKSN